MAAAEELGVPLDRVRLVMGDTDQVPTTEPPRQRHHAPDGAGVRSAAAAYKQKTGHRVKDWKVLGTPHVRLDASDIVTGRIAILATLCGGNALRRVLRAPSYGQRW